MEMLEQLAAIEDIKRLKARYFRCMDTKDWDGLARVFAPDAAFDLREVNSVRHPLTMEWEPPYGGMQDVYTGHAAVVGMIRNAVQTLVTVHHGHMPEIEILDENSARGIWAMEDIIRNAPGAPPLRMQGYGHYHETYARLAAGWVIRTTRITRLYLTRE